MDQRVRRLAEGSLAPSTWVTYQREWRLFQAFAEVEKASPLPASAELVGRYVAWMVEMGRGGMTSVAVAAVGKIHDLEGKQNPIGGRWLRMVVEGAEREAAKGRRIRPRDPLPVSAVLQFASQPQGALWLRDLAVLVLGMRAMRRAAELRALRQDDVWFKDDVLVVRVCRQKNDQKAAGQLVYIEPTGKLTCPVGVMREYLRQRGEHQGWLFEADGGRQLSTGAISSIVKKVASNAGLKGWFSSHSLRIGGATAAMAGGMTKEQIKAIGGWTSDAVDRYLRAVEPLQQGASRLMGL